MPEKYILDSRGATVNADEVTIPSSRHFRGAWVTSGDVISEDLDAAKVIFKDKIREVRKPLLDEEDVVYMKALEANKTSDKTASVAKKNSLRDAPEAAAIADATTIDELMAAWDESLLGDSPYK